MLAVLANSEYLRVALRQSLREFFKSIYYEEHLQNAASENVFMKLKKRIIHKITILAF